MRAASRLPKSAPTRTPAWPTRVCSTCRYRSSIAARQLTGEKPIELAPNEYLVDNTVDKSADYAKALGQKGRTITVDGHELTASGQVVSQSLQVSNMSCLIAVLVVPDELAADRLAAGDLPSMSELNVNLVGDSPEQAMKDLMAEYGKAVPPSEEHAEMGSTYESGAMAGVLLLHKRGRYRR